MVNMILEAYEENMHTKEDYDYGLYEEQAIKQIYRWMVIDMMNVEQYKKYLRSKPYVKNN